MTKSGPVNYRKLNTHYFPISRNGLRKKLKKTRLSAGYKCVDSYTVMDLYCLY